MFIPFLSYVLNSAWVHAKSGFPGGATGKENTHPNAGDIREAGSIPGSGRSPEGGHSNPLP